MTCRIGEETLFPFGMPPSVVFPSTPKMNTKPWPCADGMRERAAVRKGRSRVDVFIMEAQGMGEREGKGGEI